MEQPTVLFLSRRGLLCLFLPHETKKKNIFPKIHTAGNFPYRQSIDKPAYSGIIQRKTKFFILF